MTNALKSIYAALTPRERAQQVVVAWLAGERPDQMLRTTAREKQWNVAAGLIADTQRGRRELGRMVERLQGKVEAVELRWALLATLRCLPEEETLPASNGFDLARELVEDEAALCLHVAEQWRRLRLIELAYDWFSQRLGVDIVEPGIRRELDTLRVSLLAVQEDLRSSCDAAELPEPDDEEDVAVVRWINEQR